MAQTLLQFQELIHWGSGYQTCPVFKCLKHVWVPNNSKYFYKASSIFFTFGVSVMQDPYIPNLLKQFCHKLPHLVTSFLDAPKFH